MGDEEAFRELPDLGEWLLVKPGRNGLDIHTQGGRRMRRDDVLAVAFRVRCARGMKKNQG